MKIAAERSPDHQASPGEPDVCRNLAIGDSSSSTSSTSDSSYHAAINGVVPSSSRETRSSTRIAAKRSRDHQASSSKPDICRNLTDTSDTSVEEHSSPDSSQETESRLFECARCDYTTRNKFQLVSSSNFCAPFFRHLFLHISRIFSAFAHCVTASPVLHCYEELDCKPFTRIE